MLNLFIVDDEKIVIDSLLSIIKWEKFGIRPSGWATNGKDAYNAIVEKDIDIVIVDIRMPKMNGLELIKKIKEQKPTTTFIVCSGYSNFNYAKEAIKYGTIYYLIKPVDIDELIDAIKTAKAIVLKNAQHGHLYEKEKSNSILKTIIYHNYNEIYYDKYIIATSFINELNHYIHIVDRIIYQIINSNNYKIKYFFNQNELILLFTNNENKHLITKVLHNIIQRLQEEIGLKINWGIGKNQYTTKNIHESYIQSKKAIKYAEYFNKDIAFANEIYYSNSKTMNIDISVLLNIILHSNNQTKLIKIKEFINSIVKQALKKSLRPDVLIYHCSEINIYITNYLGKLYNIPIEDLYKHSYKETKEINKSKNAYEIGQITFKCLSNLLKFIEQQEKDHIKRTINKIKEYVNNNINKSISINDIAEIIHYTPSYTGDFFKKQTGMNLLSYITKTRMDKAKKMLLNSNLRIKYISDKVGYRNQRYFCQVFKKYFGVTPTKFRNSKRP